MAQVATGLTKTLYAYVTPTNAKFIKAGAKKHRVSISKFVDTAIESVRLKKAFRVKRRETRADRMRVSKKRG